MYTNMYDTMIYHYYYNIRRAALERSNKQLHSDSYTTYLVFTVRQHYIQIVANLNQMKWKKQRVIKLNVTVNAYSTEKKWPRMARRRKKPTRHYRKLQMTTNKYHKCLHMSIMNIYIYITHSPRQNNNDSSSKYIPSQSMTFSLSQKHFCLSVFFPSFPFSCVNCEDMTVHHI